MGRRPDRVSRAHALLRAWLPARLRREHGQEMEEVFRERLSAAPGGLRRWRMWGKEARDLAVTGARLRWGGRTGGGVTVGGWTDDVRGVVRGLARSPGFLFFAVGTLALGVGASVAFSAFLDRIVLRPVDFPEANRLVGVWRSNGALLLSPDAATLELVEGSDAFDRVAATGETEVVLSTESGSASVWAARIDAALPDLAGLPAVLGRYFAPEELAGEGAPVVVLSEGAWERRFGRDPGVLGTTIALDGDPYTVVGVAPERLTAPMPARVDVELWLPLPEAGEERGMNVLARLAPGVTLEMARERMKALEEGAAEQPGGDRWSTNLTPVDQMVVGFLRKPLRAVGAAAVLLLLIACLNTANLLLARGDARRRETALRAALGAGRFRLGRELFLESTVVAALASAAGLALAAGAVSFVRRARPADLFVFDALHLDPVVVLGALALTCATALLFGVLPLVHRLRTDPGRALADRGGTSDGDAVAMRRLLLVGEVALSFALLATAVQLSGAIRGLQSRDPGMAVDEVVVANVDLPSWRFPDDESRQEALDRIVAAARRMPGARAVSVASHPPTRPGIFFGTPEAEGAELQPEAEGSAVFYGGSVGAGYFAAIGRPVLEGREFVEEDLRREGPVVILGEGAAQRFFPEGDAVGRRFRIGEGDWWTVVGVVGDAWVTGRANDSGYPQMYVPSEDGQGHAVHVRTDDPETTARLLAAIVRDTDPEIPAGGVQLARTLYRNALARERMISMLLLGFSAAAAALAAIGLYGVIAQLALRRVREFGIRISVGAERRQIFALVVRGGAAPVLAGLVIGAGIAWLGLRFLESGIVGLDAARPLPFAVAALLLGASAALAVALPARRAAGTDPMEALRAD